MFKNNMEVHSRLCIQYIFVNQMYQIREPHAQMLEIQARNNFIRSAQVTNLVASNGER